MSVTAAVNPLRVVVWGENIHEQTHEVVQQHYPDGMHTTIAAGIREQAKAPMQVSTALLEQPEHGLSQQVLDHTDVLVWWGHRGHDQVADQVVDRVHAALLGGMGLVVLHSGHHSKIFRKAMGTSCNLHWRNEGDRELIWTVDPGHPIAQGVPNPMVLEHHEMFGEFFDIPTPDELVFISSFSGGEVFRGGITYRRGKGKLFYFSPGDQYYPIYHDPNIRRVLANGVQWAAPTVAERGVPPVVKQPLTQY